MKQLSITIAFGRFCTIPSIIDTLSLLSEATRGDIVVIHFNFSEGHTVYPEHLAVVTAFIKLLKMNGIKVTAMVSGEHTSQARYASRMNFFLENDIKYREDFVRHDNQGNLVEITQFDNQNDFEVHKKVLSVLNTQGFIDQSVLKMLDLCLYEVIDNVYNHARSPINGIVVAQNYNYTKEIRVVIVDTGVGIHHSLTKPEISRFKTLTPEQALEQCINKGVTNGVGLGNGLYFTSSFVAQNDGFLQLYSGNHYLQFNSRYYKVIPGKHWQGTILFMKLRTDKFVDKSKIEGISENSDDDFEFLYGNLFD